MLMQEVTALCHLMEIDVYHELYMADSFHVFLLQRAACCVLTAPVQVLDRGERRAKRRTYDDGRFVLVNVLPSFLLYAHGATGPNL